MSKLLPRHMEIIEEIDKRFIAIIQLKRPELESKISGMRILDNNPKKPVVKMANLCLVSAHTALDYLEEAEYDTGNSVEDLKSQSLVKGLLHNPKLQAACPLPFDEAKLWKGQSGPELKHQIQRQFRNISWFPVHVTCIIHGEVVSNQIY